MKLAHIGVATLALVACSGRSAPVKRARPLAVRVVDSADGTPVPGARVLYAVRVMVAHEGLAGMIPLGGPKGPRVVYGAEALTDARGEVTFPGEFEISSPRERIDAQFVAVNVQVNSHDDDVNGITEAISSLCSSDASTCPSAAPEIATAVFLLASGNTRLDAVFTNPNPRFGASARVWEVDDPRTVRDPLTGRLGADPLPSPLGNRASPLIVRLARRASRTGTATP